MQLSINTIQVSLLKVSQTLVFIPIQIFAFDGVNFYSKFQNLRVFHQLHIKFQSFEKRKGPKIAPKRGFAASDVYFNYCMALMATNYYWVMPIFPVFGFYKRGASKDQINFWSIANFKNLQYENFIEKTTYVNKWRDLKNLNKSLQVPFYGTTSP